MSDIEQIRRAHASARPTPENPAWMNCHRDCGVLLGEIERLRAVLSGRARWQEIERLQRQLSDPLKAANDGIEWRDVALKIAEKEIQMLRKLGEKRFCEAAEEVRKRGEEIARLRAIETAALRIASLHADDDGDYIVTAELMGQLDAALEAALEAT